ncbi:NADPH-dependent F420 reductase [Streptomyces sp. MNP-20]|uniref:NADPH-dependent F420 reductase n=1 Tax=Streptomyces sp. MNP-20 TaxID=2721165 RepID=UPI001552C123|nr:NAD(P)-binding domain-containing protein [Streptomyces sp. MNP-20]
MRIGVLGTGDMADALGGQWARAGHEVFVGGRDAARAAELAARIGAAGHGSLRDAAEFGDGAVLLALPYGVGEEVATGLADALRGRVLVDCCNPVGEGFTLLTGRGPAAAERLAAAAPGARVVKAFNLCHESVWRLTPPVFDGQRLAVPVCADDAPARDTVGELTRALGCVPYDAGGLGRAGLVEATAALLIGLWVGGGVDARAIMPPFDRAGG